MNKKNYIKAINKYNKEKMKLYSFRFHRENQSDIIDYIDSLPNKAGYIANLIREDMRRKGIEVIEERTIADLIGLIEDNEKVVLTFPDKSMLATCKENLTPYLNRKVRLYQRKPDGFYVEVRYA